MIEGCGINFAYVVTVGVEQSGVAVVAVEPERAVAVVDDARCAATIAADKFSAVSFLQADDCRGCIYVAVADGENVDLRAVAVAEP